MKVNAKWVAVVIVGVVIGLLALGLFAPETPKLKAEVLSGTEIVKVINHDNFDWRNTRIEINDGYSQNVGWLGAGDTGTYPLSRFSKSDGTRFNGYVTKVKDLRIDAATPKGSASYNGESD